jgi:hypothetical protein
MRAMIVGAALALGGMSTPPGPAEAEPFRHYPWCLEYSGDDSQATNCGFATWQQCMATASGAGGVCYENPWYYAALPPAAEAPRVRSRRR